MNDLYTSDDNSKRVLTLTCEIVGADIPKELSKQGYAELEKLVSEHKTNSHALHSHKHYEIYFLTKGASRIMFSNSVYNISAPAIVIIPPHKPHSTESGPFERYNFDVAESYLNPFQLSIINKKQLQLLTPTPEQASKLESLLEELNNLENNKYYTYVFSTLFSYYLHEISKLDNNSDNNNNIIVHSSNFTPPIVVRIMDYLKENYYSNITLEDLTEQFNISKSSLIYNFNKYLKTSPTDYLINIRVDQAKELLKNTGKSMSEIAEDCGFSSANYFSLMFKRKTGISPANYRNNRHPK